MKPLLTIASGEWWYWRRSHLVLSGTIIFAVLIVVTSLLTVQRIEAESHTREHQQTEAEETFLSQPDRHPHRMVHYGHYVFRSPVALSLFDPGLDSVTGQSIFLEGHRQNSAMFAESTESADFGVLSWLTPAFIYQLFAPLLIILIGHGSVVRERDAKVMTSMMAQGIGAYTIIFGKASAMLTFILLLLIPMFVSSWYALINGETLFAVTSLMGTYFIYLAIWALLTLCVSTIMKRRSNILACLTVCWLSITLILPSIAVNIVAKNMPISSKIETDLAMLSELRKLGDGHNANDVAFTELRAKSLKQYNVDSIEALPFNYRGLVAMNAEAKLSKVLNSYASMRMDAEVQQARRLADYAWFTPALAIASASRAISGTDIEHYHRFLREAEDIRFNFVQGLHNAQTNKLSYQDDINRNRDETSWLRARVDSSNWKVLDTFAFEPANATMRLIHASQPIAILIVWFVVLLGTLFRLARSLQP